MGENLRWCRPVEDKTGKLVRLSKCGRYSIVKRHYASMGGRNGYFTDVGYVLTVASTGRSETFDSLRDAKDGAEMDNDPGWEPS